MHIYTDTKATRAQSGVVFEPQSSGAVHAELYLYIDTFGSNTASTKIGFANDIGGNDRYSVAYATSDGNIWANDGGSWTTLPTLGAEFQEDTWQKWEMDFYFDAGGDYYTLTLEGVTSALTWRTDSLASA